MTTRRLTSASILAVGTELTTGSTRDTNSGDLARALTDHGVEVRRMAALPDDLEAVSAALAGALVEVDLVVSTGGLGPTPDDLTREAIAAVCHEVPVVDQTLAAAMLALFERRGLPMPETNLKQAWAIPSSSPIVNANGTAPGWWVDRPDGRVIVALPGPPREMTPMWQGTVLPRLLERGLGLDRATETWRLTGIGESALVALIGDDVLRGTNPTVATYARPDAVDVRISASGSEGVRAADLVVELGQRLEPILAPYRFARGDVSWPDAIGARLGDRRVAVVEIGTGGEVAALLGAAPWFTFGETLALDWPHAFAHRDLTVYARRVREVAGVSVGLAVRARERRGDMAVSIAIDVDGAAERVSRTVFLAGEIGRRRAAVAAATELWRRLGAPATDPDSPAA